MAKGFRSSLDKARRILGPGILVSGLVLLMAALLYLLEKLGIRLQDASGRSGGDAGRADKTDKGRPGRPGRPDIGSDSAWQPPSEESLRHGHEPVQIKPSVVAWFGAALLAAVAVLLVGLWFLLEAFSDRKIAIAPNPTSLPQAADALYHREFRERAPGLFRDPAGYLRAFQAEEEAARPDYAWVDRERGVVSIPVERAMALVAERGLPEWDIADTAAGARPVHRHGGSGAADGGTGGTGREAAP